MMKMLRIMTTNEFLEENDPRPAIFYRAACDCTFEEHDLSMELSLDDEYDLMYLTLWKNLDYASYYKSNNWFQDKWLRIKTATKLLFTGRIKIDTEFIFGGEKHINDFIKALEYGKKEIRKIEMKRKRDIETVKKGLEKMEDEEN